MNSKSSFKIINEKGEELVCDVLFTYEDAKTKKNYIVFTDNTLDDDGKIKVYANTYDATGNDLSLGKIETEEEYDTISKLLSDLNEKVDDVNVQD